MQMVFISLLAVMSSESKNLKADEILSLFTKSTGQNWAISKLAHTFFLVIFVIIFVKSVLLKLLSDETVIEVLGVILLICSSVVLSVNLSFWVNQSCFISQPALVSRVWLMFACVGPEGFHETSGRGDICRRTSPQGQRRVRHNCL